ncbi:MAG TPA: aminodeoxychorismate lyase [Pseudonocardiaceae bacterium]|jgi:4-amino-4-deoxychorismate lyase|nr:aminodeoxychorismate lyase [Pseudonocardiaceae bacterium]
MRVLAMLNGTLADPERPQIRVDDLGLMRGDGVFETVLVTAGKPREMGPHLDRLARSAAMLDLPVPDRDAWEAAAKLVMDNWTGADEMALKLVYTRGIDGGDGTPTGFALGMDISPAVLRQRRDGVSVITLERGIEHGAAERAPWLLLGAKALSYAVNMAAIREAARRAADEVIFTESGDSVLEGPTSTVIVAESRTLRTPPTTLGILPGTTQYALFRAAEQAGWSIKVEPIQVAELHRADAVMLASSVRKITRVHTLDGAELAETAGLHAELLALYESEY